MATADEPLELTDYNPLGDLWRQRPAREAAAKRDEEEEACPAFGYLRGLRERALMVEFRLRTGDSEFHPYSHLASCRYNRSVGVLLKFTEDVTTLVLLRGSNLDVTVNQGAINLTDQGFQRHRIVWVREMDEAEIRRIGLSGPTISRIEIAECESQEEVREWLKKAAPVFLRRAM